MAPTLTNNPVGGGPPCPHPLLKADPCLASMGMSPKDASVPLSPRGGCGCVCLEDANCPPPTFVPLIVTLGPRTSF